MPITPRFTLSQTGTHVVVDIDVPHVRVSVESVQVVVEQATSILHFASPPYLLLLNFQDEDGEKFDELADENCATYIPEDHGKIRLELQKKVPGQWRNLDMIGRLVKGKQQNSTTTANWLQEVVGEDNNVEKLAQDSSPSTTTSESSAAAPIRTIIPTGAYGFARMFHGVFADLGLDAMGQEMLASVWEESEYQIHGDAYRIRRREQRIERELQEFSSERYLGDVEMEDDYLYQCAMAMVPHWCIAKDEAPHSMDQVTRKMCDLTVSSGSASHCSQDKHDVSTSFSAEEQRQLASIPYPFLPTNFSTDITMAGLLDILYAYTYDHLLTDGDSTVESAWTISILSVSLSWLEESESIQECIESSLRRTLVYPYIRNITFGLYVWKHVEMILQSGPATIVRCLLRTRDILHKSEFYYLGNKLFVDPYLGWIQKDVDRVRDLLVHAIASLRNVIRNDTSLKEILGLGLVQLEASVFECNDGENDDGSDSECSTSSDDSDDDDDSKAESSSDDPPSDTENNQQIQLRSEQDRGSEMSSALLDGNLESDMASLRLVATASQKDGGTTEATKKVLIQEM